MPDPCPHCGVLTHRSAHPLEQTEVCPWGCGEPPHAHRQCHPRNDASRAEPALAVDPSRSSPNAVAASTYTAASPAQEATPPDDSPNSLGEELSALRERGNVRVNDPRQEATPPRETDKLFAAFVAGADWRSALPMFVVDAYADRKLSAAHAYAAAPTPEATAFEAEIAGAVERVGQAYAFARKLDATRADVDLDDLGTLLGYVRSAPLAEALATVAALTADRDHWKALSNAIVNRAMDALVADRDAARQVDRAEGQQQNQGG